VYAEQVVERVSLIRKALAVGFTLDELSTILQVFDRGGAPCQQVRNLAATKLAWIETYLQEVIALRDDLEAALKDWDERLAKTASGERAGLLKNLPARNGLHSSSLLLRKPSKKKKGSKHG
jgi:DNA-binding transcriptional MerR regulator